MSAPLIVSTSPAHQSSDVILGGGIEIVFDQPIDPATVNSSTFALTWPGAPSVVDGDNLIRQNPRPTLGRNYTPGVFSFPAPEVVHFTPKSPLQPNVEYTVFLAGAGAIAVPSAIKNLTGEALATSYRFTFKTGSLNLETPPVPSPTEPVQDWEKPRLDTVDIQVSPRFRTVNNDLAQEIVLIFPADVDPASFRAEDLIVAVEAFLDDPTIPVPEGLTSSVSVAGNRITITITGWPPG